jgi:hypothetical protein
MRPKPLIPTFIDILLILRLKSSYPVNLPFGGRISG